MSSSSSSSVNDQVAVPDDPQEKATTVKAAGRPREQRTRADLLALKASIDARIPEVERKVEGLQAAVSRLQVKVEKLEGARDPGEEGGGLQPNWGHAEEGMEHLGLAKEEPYRSED
ncbi:hypothetical protein GUJ93_ZPchr0012g20740 [Zizania palustris]|uniref:Uncharacterized protein n=1 Tax=Zizania palustris TaxID=103762 RepID=A0A8J5WIR6_ZIZPA|nr:hypothetical protein GUJ93_ZPchr0012g20740 [Zizania palustris]